MKRLFCAFPIILIALLFSACAPQSGAKTGTTSAVADSGPKVSFASPEPGATVPFGPVQVMILSEDLGGTSQVEVLVNGVSVASVPSPDTAASSVIIGYTWQPSAPGNYVLQARAQNTAGTWGGFASLELAVAPEQAPAETPTVEAIPTEEPEPTVEDTDVIATESGPTETSSGPDLPSTPTRSGISLSWTFTYLQMYRYGSTCEPQQNSVIVEVSGLSKNEIGGVMIFFRPMEVGTGALWNWWTTGLWLELFPSGLYGRGFSTAHMVKRLSTQSETYWPYIPAVVLYQFAISDKGGSIIYRSDVSQNLQVKPCN
ncbi:MAG: Ig-like domain-containing protein [Anaerolineales bacterium]